MAAVGTPIRTLMQWMGHANMQTTLIYADYAPDPMQGAALAAKAFGGGDEEVRGDGLRRGTLVG
jgi:integrase